MELSNRYSNKNFIISSSMCKVNILGTRNNNNYTNNLKTGKGLVINIMNTLIF